MLSTEVQDRINDAMSALSQRERAAFVLRHFEGNSIEDISRSLGLKTNATKHSIFRAVRKMRAALEPLVRIRRNRQRTTDQEPGTGTTNLTKNAEPRTKNQQ